MGPPTFTQPGTQGPLLYPEGAHGAPLRSVSLPEKNFRSFAAKKIFRFTDGFNQKNKFTVGFPTKKKFTRACAREFFLSESVVFLFIFFKFKNIFVLKFENIFYKFKNIIF